MKIRTSLKSGNAYGSFEDSCNDVSIERLPNDDLVISANCRGWNGAYGMSSVFVPHNYDYSDDIANCGGSLTLGGC